MIIKQKRCERSIIINKQMNDNNNDNNNNADYNNKMVLLRKIFIYLIN